MTTTLTMPIVGETVTEGTVERWLKKPGDHVDKYEPIVEINTDKVDVELPSPVSGTVQELLAEEGAVVAVGAPLAIIEEVAGEAQDEAPPPEEERPSVEAVAPAGPQARRRAGIIQHGFRFHTWNRLIRGSVQVFRCACLCA